MAFQLRHCVIHELVKESGKQRVEAIIKQVLPTDDKYVQELVKSLNDLIGKKKTKQQEVLLTLRILLTGYLMLSKTITTVRQSLIHFIHFQLCV